MFACAPNAYNGSGWARAFQRGYAGLKRRLCNAVEHFMRLGAWLGLVTLAFALVAGPAVCWPCCVVLVLDSFQNQDDQWIFQLPIWIPESEGKDFLRNVNCRYITGEPYTARLL